MAVNIFKNVRANLITTGDTIYTCPAGYSGIILMAQISNITSGTVDATMNVVDGATETSLITGFQIPGNNAAGALTGKLVLTPGQQITASASADSSLQLILSILESQN